MDRKAVLPDIQPFSNKSKNVLLISSLPDIRPDIRKPNIIVFIIQYPARYRIAQKWPDFARYRILNRISGPSLVRTHLLYIFANICIDFYCLIKQNFYFNFCSQIFFQNSSFLIKMNFFFFQPKHA